MGVLDPATSVGTVCALKKQVLASEGGMSEECDEGLSTGSWNETMDHSRCAWGQLLGRGTCLYFPLIMCVGYVGSLPNHPQDQPMSEGPVGSVEGHRVWAGVAAGQAQYHTSTWGTSEFTSACEPRLVHMCICDL